MKLIADCLNRSLEPARSNRKRFSFGAPAETGVAAEE